MLHVSGARSSRPQSLESTRFNEPERNRLLPRRFQAETHAVVE